MNKQSFRRGLMHGVPIFLGYLAVSFSFGIFAVSSGLSIAETVLISMTNLTSAGQLASVPIILGGGGLLELGISQLVINLRYALMSISLSQRMDGTVRMLDRFVIAFANTDEVFALGMTRLGKLSASYFVGAGTVAAIGWISGTAMGAVAGSLLPESVRTALGIMLYGMFIAIVVPQAKQEKPMLICLVLALLLSCLFYWMPVLHQVSAGIAIVICTVVAAAVCAWLFPVEEEEVAA